jgi:hypothetical protein
MPSARPTKTKMSVYAYLDVDVPWIAWLVYRGEMVSARSAGDQMLSVWHAKYLFDASGPRQRVNYYNRELEIERVRAARFPLTVSRLTGLYFFDDVEAARRAWLRWDGSFRGEHLAEIEITRAVGSSRFDSEWITADLPVSDDGWITSYLASEPRGPRPLWELLVDGRGVVLGTGVRERAYETIKRTWPQSLALLELSRVAVELGSDLGLITPVVTADEAAVEVKLYLDFRDATNDMFLARLARFSGPKNTVDLNPSRDLVVPDLREYVARFDRAGNIETAEDGAV